MYKSAVLALEDGSYFEGQGIGAIGAAVGEVVFNTAMTGYQEILSDPSYASQIVTLTCPHIGNVGISDWDNESYPPCLSGLVIRDLSPLPSNWRSQMSLSEYLCQNSIVAIAGIDTRRLTQLLREQGSLKGVIQAGDNLPDPAELSVKLSDFSGLKGQDLAKVVSTKNTYSWGAPLWSLSSNHTSPTEEAAQSQANTSNSPGFKVVVYDFGVKRNMLRILVSLGCEVTVVPAQTPAENVLQMQPDGVFLSNGPGDPEPCDYAVKAIRIFLDKSVPLFGICLGHQLLALASGAATEKMKFGHHGANHPVQDLKRGHVMITSQNHGFTVSEHNLPDSVVVTHRSLFDQSVQGIALKDKPAFGFQGHPEASPGPQDAMPLFENFLSLMKTKRPLVLD